MEIDTYKDLYEENNDWYSRLSQKFKCVFAKSSCLDRALTLMLWQQIASKEASRLDVITVEELYARLANDLQTNIEI